MKGSLQKEVYYPKDLKERAIKYVKSHRAKKAKEAFGIEIRTVFERRRLLGKNGNLKRKFLNRKPKKLDMDGLGRYEEGYPNTCPREMEGPFKVSKLTLAMCLEYVLAEIIFMTSGSWSDTSYRIAQI